jgi:hypothetical protein
MKIVKGEGQTSVTEKGINHYAMTLECTRKGTDASSCTLLDIHPI